MAIAAGVIGDHLVTATVTLIQMTAQGRRATALDGPQGTPVHARQRGSAGLEKTGALTNDIGYFQNGVWPWARRRPSGLRQQRQRVQRAGGGRQRGLRDMQVAGGGGQAAVTQ
jgi:hypothetical protein